MYLDFSNTSRSDWKYSYKGGEVSPYAEKLLEKYIKDELDLRKKASEQLMDFNTSVTSEKSNELKKQLENIGRIKETLEVFTHEFRRTPEREFHLSAGDVVFFGLNKQLGN